MRAHDRRPADVCKDEGVRLGSMRRLLHMPSARGSRRHSAAPPPAGRLLCPVCLLLLLLTPRADGQGAQPAASAPVPSLPGPSVYIAGTFGRFTGANGVVANVTGVAEWRNNAMLPLGTGLSLPQEAFALDYHAQPPECVRRCQNSRTCLTTCATPGRTPALYLGGTFTSANGEEVYRITVARNGSMQEVDKGVANTVNAIAVHQPSGIIYLGGLFVDATGVPVRYVTSWDGINWDQMGGGVSNPFVCKANSGGIAKGEEPVVYALALMGGTDKAAPLQGTSVPPSQYGTEMFRPKVFVGGRFRRAGEGVNQVTAHHVALWDPAAANGQGINSQKVLFMMILYRKCTEGTDF